MEDTIMKKRPAARLICLIVAATILTGTLTVAAINGSPYDILKTALFDAVMFENVTLDGEFTMRVNGVVDNTQRARVVHTSQSALSFYSTFDRNLGARESVNFDSPELSLSTSTHGPYQGVWYSVTVRGQQDIANRADWRRTTIGGMSADERYSNWFRLAEVGLDLVVGNLRNNISISHHGDGVRRVGGAITESQIPEIVRILVDIGAEESYRRAGSFQRRDGDGVFDIPMRSMIIDRVSGHADIDAMGRLIYFHGLTAVTVVDMFGVVSAVEFEVNLHFSDFGTSVPYIPVPGVAELFTLDFVELHTENAWNRRLHFQLDAFGNIDQSTITDQWPRGNW